MARQCGIVKQEIPVYYGDVGEKKINGKSVIVWKDFESADQVLNPNTLTPDEEKTEHELENNKNAEIQENTNEAVAEKYEMKKANEGEEKIRRFEITTTLKKSKLYYFSFGEKNLKLPTPQNFRQFSAFRDKYVLSDIGKNSCFCHKTLK